MDFPRAYFVLFFLFAGYLVLQCFLFFRFRDTLKQRVKGVRLKKLYTGLAAFFFLAMLYPAVWRVFFGHGVYEPHPALLRGFAAFWTFGSTGAALIFLGYGLLSRLGPMFRPSSAATAPVDPARRDFLKKGVAVAAAAPFAVSGYGVVYGARRFQVERFGLPLEGISSALSQLTIAHLTDIHVGPFMPKEELSVYVEAANRLKPDLVALTGDFVAANPAEAIPCVEALAGLEARLGVFACLGNHDFFAGAAEALVRLMEQKGIRVLRNNAVSIPIGNTSLQVLGIDDLIWGDPDLGRALAAAQGKAGEVRLLLSHRPEIFPEAARRGFDIVLSGHYHGGQIKLAASPGSPSVASLLTPYAEGLFHLPRAGGADKSSLLFVSRGIGVTGLPVRINCSPQIAHLTLVKS